MLVLGIDQHGGMASSPNRPSRPTGAVRRCTFHPHRCQNGVRAVVIPPAITSELTLHQPFCQNRQKFHRPIHLDAEDGPH